MAETIYTMSSILFFEKQTSERRNLNLIFS